MMARVRDTELYFDVEGAGLSLEDGVLRERPVAMLIHGGPGVDHSGLRFRYSELSRHMQLVYFDHRGHGRSARGNPSTYTLDENVEDLEALRRHLGLGKIVSIGTSYGGWVAQAHAARYPDAVSHLILIATVSNGRNLDRAREILTARGSTEQIALFDDLMEGRIDSSGKFQHYLNVLGPLYARGAESSALGTDAVILEAEPLNRGMGPGGFLRTGDLRPELHRITAPTLVAAGRHDWICAPEFSEEIHNLIPGSELHICENSSHLISGDDKVELLETIAEFVSRVRSGNEQASGALALR